MSEPRRHHFVPESFLRRFADEKEQLRATWRDGSGEFVAHVSKIAAEKDLYTFDTPDGPSYEVEKLLGSTFETEAAAAIDRVVAGSLPAGADRATLAYFVALQFVRGPDLRAGLAHTQDALLRLALRVVPDARVAEAIRARHGRDPGPNELRDLRAAWDDSRILTFPLHRNNALRRVFGIVNGLAQVALARRWIVVQSAHAALLTSDSPVVTCSKADAPGSAGFGTADEVRLSLDRRHVLVLTWDDRVREGFLDATPAFVDDQNRLTATKAYRVYLQHPQAARVDVPTRPPVTGGSR